jgi:GntR family transcriptional regulator of arabinose operon
LEHNVVGIIIEPAKSARQNENIKLLEDIKSRGIKTVFINAVYDDFDSSYVLLDDIKGATIATEYLIQLGHKRIAGIFKTDDKQGVYRKNGYIASMKKYGIYVDDKYIGEYETENMYDYPYMFAQALIREKDYPTAFFCYNDQCAQMAGQAIKDAGLKIPSGIDLTTILHPKKDMGRQAAKYVIDMLDGRLEKPQMIYRPELIVRNSCKNL